MPRSNPNKWFASKELYISDVITQNDLYIDQSAGKQHEFVPVRVTKSASGLVTLSNEPDKLTLILAAVCAIGAFGFLVASYVFAAGILMALAGFIAVVTLVSARSNLTTVEKAIFVHNHWYQKP